ncbi:MAG: MFS transporter [Verrucomicrobiota bacterium JB022]|nr:MFS transporter [Verrucomicrobiota bacterium JB022]
MAATEPSPQNQKRTLGVIFLTVFLDLVGFSIIFPLFPAMLHYYLELEGPNSLIGGMVERLAAVVPDPLEAEFLTTVLFGGIIGSLYSLLQFFSAAYWGRTSDYKGRRRVLLLTVTGVAVSYLLWFFSGHFWALLISRALGGLMAGNIAVATAAIADVTDEKGRGKGMALIGVAFGLGFILGPAIGAVSATYFNPLHIWPSLEGIGLHPFSGAALVALLLSLVNLVWVWRSFPETLAVKKAKPTLEEGQKRPNRLAEIFIVKSQVVQLVIFVYLIFVIAFAGMEFSLTFLARERLLYSPLAMTKIFVFIGLMLLISQGMVVRRLSPKIGEMPLIFVGFLMVFLALVCLGAALQAPLFYTGLGLLGFGAGLVSPSLTAAASRFSPADEQGTNLGAFRSAGALARAIGPLAGALIYYKFGSDFAYYAAAGLVLVSLAMSFTLPKLPPGEKVAKQKA